MGKRSGTGVRIEKIVFYYFRTVSSEEWLLCYSVRDFPVELFIEQ